jgi:hypothetical protein
VDLKKKAEREVCSVTKLLKLNCSSVYELPCGGLRRVGDSRVVSRDSVRVVPKPAAPPKGSYQASFFLYLSDSFLLPSGHTREGFEVVFLEVSNRGDWKMSVQGHCLWLTEIV